MQIIRQLYLIMDRRAADDARARQQQSGSRPSGAPASYTPYIYQAATQYQQPYVDPSMAASMYVRQPYVYPPQPPGSLGGSDRYGYAPTGSSGGTDRYGYVPSHHHNISTDMYMRQHHYGAPLSHQSPHGAVPTSSSKPSPPVATLEAVVNASAAQSTAKTPSNPSPAKDRESGADVDSKTPATPSSFGGSTGSPKSSSKVPVSSPTKAKKEKKAIAHEVTELEDLHIDKWYSGSIPLGLEDDKYWLSELQVFLRSSFAEAFGATEEDIAAPMHGRNKPIALGQVGIRCIWCKREYNELCPYHDAL